VNTSFDISRYNIDPTQGRLWVFQHKLFTWNSLLLIKRGAFMDTVWIVVAESSRAKIYVTDLSAKKLRELEGFVHSDSRRHAHDITSDLPGRKKGGGDGSHHALEAETGIKEGEAVLFAQQIDNYLLAGRNENQFDQLVLIAAPAFLGLLRRHMDTQVAKLVVHELPKNLVKSDVAEIRKHLPRHF
jgi:protein required for attachment to host cells